MSYLVSHIASIIHAKSIIRHDTVIEHLLLDSRKIQSAEKSLFFAIKGERRDGHQFIPELYERGVRNFIVSHTMETDKYPSATFLQVTDTLEALQQLAAYHRQQFDIPVIGITGSNGKTIVKEWLYQLLHPDYRIVRSPKSYNSQIGVPLSIWQINSTHTLGIFEAGISKPGEMQKLADIIQPTIGVLTNIGEAHSEGFSSREEKEKEKRLLLEKTIIPQKMIIRDFNKSSITTGIKAIHPVTNEEIQIQIPFTDQASINNAITCWEVMLLLGIGQQTIHERMMHLLSVNMRLELKKGINHCTIINDSYSADLSSLEIALNFLSQQSANQKKTLILSDFLQSSMDDESIYEVVFDTIKKHKIDRFIGIGEKISLFFNKNVNQPYDGLSIGLYPSTADFIQHFRSSDFRDETILIKGARVFSFEQVVHLLEQKVHQTVLEINLNSITHNLNEYQRLLKPSTRIMAMVKAFAYGSGGAEIAGILQYHKVDYLGVAYADEGVELRRAGIHLPVMIMNPDLSSFELIVENNLEPEIYSFELLHTFSNWLEREGISNYPIHIEIETGMNRLGFASTDIDRLAGLLKSNEHIRVQSVFTHLAASEDEKQDEFSLKQFDIFQQAADLLQAELGYAFIRHIANSAAIVRHPIMQLDMVRLGIGLYGVDSAGSGKINLHVVATLKSTIAQIKNLKKGESVSYNRRAVVKKDTTIATIRIGYADGFPRRLGNGKGKVWIREKIVPVIGTVCMDMFMVDITGIDGISEEDEVIIFGAELPVEQLASDAETIPYEIMTGISQRVKRVYYEE